jgi:deoxyadenosine/deoxycytidine kinase
MGKLIAVIGNTAAGKTTLVARLAAAAPFVTGLEQHAERPFQQALADEVRAGRSRRYALANQIDYLLLRAEQEQTLRAQAGIALVDGGLDEDFFVFTRGFYAAGHLEEAEFALCERFYRFVRTILPEPDLYILLEAPVAVLSARLAQRQRAIEIATAADLDLLQQQVATWRECIPAPQLVVVDAAAERAFSSSAIDGLLAVIHARFGPAIRPAG